MTIMNIFKMFLLLPIIVTSMYLANTYVLQQPETLSEPIAREVDQKQLQCLADNIYHEAGYESADGKQAVALVTLNRTQNEKFPKDICGVVKQKIENTCQFSWFCTSTTLNRNTFAYKQSMEIALYVYANYEQLRDITHGALFYHADYVNPRWRGVEKTVVIGRHIFYKEKERI